MDFTRKVKKFVWDCFSTVLEYVFVSVEKYESVGFGESGSLGDDVDFLICIPISRAILEKKQIT